MTAANRLSTRPLSERFGIEVLDLELGRPVSDETKQQLHALWIEHGVLLFRGLGTSDEALLEVSRWFGELEIHPVNSNLNAAHPEILDISYHPPKDESDLSAPVYDVDGVRTCSWIPWHSDLVYMDKINRGGILRAIKVPATRGTTGFIDRIAAYDVLSDSLKTRIEGLHVLYQLNVHMQAHPFIRSFAREVTPVRSSSVSARIDAMIKEGKYPPVAHPMVYVQKETGRKVLNVSPTFAFGIVEMPNGEGDALLREVIDGFMAAKIEYHHVYEDGDLVLFDNWRVMHQADGVDFNQERLMQRTTIKGDYALGRKLAA